MMIDTEDILTLAPEFLIDADDLVTGELMDLDLDDLLGLSDDFPHELPFHAPAPHNFSVVPDKVVRADSPAFAGAPEYIGELVEVLDTVALVPQRRQEAPPLNTEVAPVTAAPLDREKHVVFSVAGAKYAVPMKQVLEVRDLEHCTPVMNVPAWVLGITNLRGDIVSVIDLQKLVETGGSGTELPATEPAQNLIVVQTRKGELTTCLAVERVHGMVQAAPSEIQAIDRIFGDGLTPHTRGLVAQSEELLSVLNLESLLRSLEITQ
jgi:purine-binding chemotaxis protein CheW